MSNQTKLKRLKTEMDAAWAAARAACDAARVAAWAVDAAWEAERAAARAAGAARKADAERAARGGSK